MSVFKQVYVKYMDAKGIKYIDKDERHVEVRYTGKNLDTIRIHVFFDKDDGDTVQFACWDVRNFTDKVAQCVLVCNELNKKYRWIKFYMDADKDVRCEADLHVDLGTCGEECSKMVRRMVNIIDEGYPVIMKAYWS